MNPERIRCPECGHAAPLEHFDQDTGRCHACDLKRWRSVQVFRPGVVRGNDVFDLSPSTFRTHSRRSGGS